MSFNAVALIDDDPNLIKIGTTVLTKIGGKKVTSFISGEDFLAYIKDHVNIYDVILIDVNMPEMLGTEVVDRIVEKHPEFNTPIIFLTGMNDKNELKELFNHTGVIGVISKPFDPMELIHLVDDLLEAKSGV
ncbi:MAG: response regulator [Pelagibacteraceae bacterium]|jgi:two-component system, OmpR family, alkaline phosphatase synthesis response regulator PhoP|nr:response regulator [Pelagibacteraceae bacterium]MBT7610793.1 response regulator [Bacteriovoracaceae bacterium]